MAKISRVCGGVMCRSRFKVDLIPVMNEGICPVRKISFGLKTRDWMPGYRSTTLFSK